MESTGVPARPDPVQVALATLADSRRSGVVLVGPSGSGKTHALRGVVRGLSSARKVSNPPAVLGTGGLRPRAIRALLEPARPGAGSPVRRILVVDDLDLWSPSLLHLLSDAVDARRTTLVATVRSSALGGLLSSFRPADVPALIELRPWRAAELSDHTRSVLDGPLHPVDGAELLRFSSGNPLCLVEMLEHGRQTGHLQRRHAVWTWSRPPAVPPVTAARVWAGLGGEPAEVLDLLTTLAVADPLPLPVLVHLHPLAVVTDAEERGWLRSVPHRHGVAVGLARHLDGAVAAAEVSPLRQRTLRAALVDALVAERHDEGGAVVDAVAACLESGVHVPLHLRTSTAVAALRHHRTALALELTDGLAVPVAVHVRAVALAEQGRFAESAAVLGGDPGEGARTTATASPRAWRAWSAVSRAVAGAADDAGAVDDTDDSAATADGADPVPAVCAAAWSGRDLEATAAAGRRALTTSRPSDPSRLLCLAATSWAYLQLGQVEQALALAGSVPTGSPALETSTPGCLLAFTVGLASLVRGSVREAGARGARLCRVGIDERWHLAYGLGALLRGAAAMVDARPDLARRRLSESAVSLALAAPAAGRRGVHQALALADRMAGREPEVVGGAPRDVRTAPAPRLLVELGDLAEAEALLLGGRRRAAVDLAGLVADRARSAGWPLVLVLALHLLVRADPTSPVVDELVRTAATADFDLAGRYGAHAVAAAGADRRGLADVAEHYEGVGMRWLAAETAAAALAGADRSHLGAAWASRAKRLLRRLQQDDAVVLPGWWDAASAPVVPVTPRELEIAEAVVRGETSAQIAQRLNLSRRTVENHLQHIYRKLGVTRRADLELAYGTVVPRVRGTASPR